MSQIADHLDAGLPANIDAERTVLGAVLLDNAAWQQIVERLRPADFFFDSHQRIGRAIKKLTDQGRTADIITLAELLGTQKELDAVGGVTYLAQLTEGLPMRPVIDDYLRIIKEKSILRQLMATCTTVISRAEGQSESALEILADLSNSVEKLVEPTKESTAGHVSKFLPEAVVNFNREYRERITPCIPSGIDWFDSKAGGYRLGRITLVCARPNVGKTPLLLQSIAYHCMRGKKAVFFSLEQDKEEVLRNLLPYVTELPNRVCSRPELQTPEQNAIAAAGFEALLDWNLHIYDGDMDADQICWVMDREGKDGEVLFGLDHFGKIAIGAATKGDTRSRYNDNSERLRKKIKRLPHSALVELCQLRKVNREYWNKPPVPDDIKESGNLYEDAYACIILHRTVDDDNRKMSRETEINLCKLRAGGSTGTTKGRFETRRLSFITQAEFEMQHDDEDFIAN